jgi:hypothetical protein
VYADTISDLGFAQELANYGEYSGAPSMEHTYEYAKTLIGLMTKESHKDGKAFIIGASATVVLRSVTLRIYIPRDTSFANVLVSSLF